MVMIMIKMMMQVMILMTLHVFLSRHSPPKERKKILGQLAESESEKDVDQMDPADNDGRRGFH